jgi:proton-dependent oligopeptide transporter, POT family
MDLELGSWKVDPQQIGTLNPIFDLMLIPFTDIVLYPILSRRFPRFGPLQKMGVGMFAAAVAFICAAVLQGLITMSGEHVVSVAWQVPQYFFISVAEIFISIPILEFGYSQAPQEMKGVVQALVWFTIGLGAFAALPPLPPPDLLIRVIRLRCR